MNKKNEWFRPHIKGLGRCYVHFTSANRKGSVEHYYHFLFGFLVPLLVALKQCSLVGTAPRLYVRSCAIFDSLLKETGLPLTILSRKRHKQLGKVLKILPRWFPFSSLTVFGFDTPSEYDARRFRIAAEVLHGLLRKEIDAQSQAISRSITGDGPRVVLIDRAEPHPYYLSNKTEKKTGGRLRRSIPNIDDLDYSLRKAGLNLIFSSLEGTSLAFQFALFRNADIVIAQHGAALANIIWACPHTDIVEIVPSEDIAGNLNAFSELARSFGMPYHAIPQPGRHGPVDVNLVTRVVCQLIDARMARTA